MSQFVGSRDRRAAARSRVDIALYSSCSASRAEELFLVVLNRCSAGAKLPGATAVMNPSLGLGFAERRLEVGRRLPSPRLAMYFQRPTTTGGRSANELGRHEPPAAVESL